MIKKLIINHFGERDIVNFFKYGIVGIIGTAIHTGVLAFAVEQLSFSPLFGTILGFVFSLITSYFLNLSWTFKLKTKSKNSFVKYAIVCSLGLIINVLIMFVIVNLFELWYLIGQLVSILVVPLFNFVLSQIWVFTKSDVDLS
ncbi:GtrA family protein [Paenibacillus sp. FSL M7-1455]|uniref:GtrA family protein n=1 Tax=Paenibacillus sp. FSL M7-1455 TaxID=2975316 RepID=UPI0030FBF19C